jgi:PleD family two-component response regulator
LPDTDEAGAEVVTEKLRANLEEHVVEWNESQIQLTMTFGIASCAGTGPIHHCLKRADQALYYGKETGRNRSVLFSRDVAADGPTERTSAERASAERSEPSS